MKKLFLIFISFFLLSISFPTSVLAADIFVRWDNTDCINTVTDPNTGTVSKVATLRCLPYVFTNVVTAFLIFAGAVALFLIIFSGIKLIQSGGDPKQVQAARGIMTYAIIGVIVVLSSFAIIYFIGYITKSTDCITDINAIKTGGCQ